MEGINGLIIMDGGGSELALQDMTDVE